MSSTCSPPSSQDDTGQASLARPAPQRRAWAADFVPVSENDPDLQAALRQLQWALDTENQD